MAEQEPAYRLAPIGRVRSDIASRQQAPKQGRDANSRAVIELAPEWAPALEDLAEGAWLWVMCWFHQAEPPRLKVHPRGNASRPLRSLFATRAPCRPNPISLNLVRLLSKDGASLAVEGLEAFDGTPVLDIKPYVPQLDSPAGDA